jgi:hypothetical protein
VYLLVSKREISFLNILSVPFQTLGCAIGQIEPNLCKGRCEISPVSVSVAVNHFKKSDRIIEL